MKEEKSRKRGSLFGDVPCRHGTYELCSKCLCETEEDKALSDFKSQLWEKMRKLERLWCNENEWIRIKEVLELLKEKS